MELQDTRFMRFMTNFWIKYQKFRGASRICAIFLNFLILVFKAAFCGIIFVIFSPHLAAGALRRQQNMNTPERVIYVILVIVSLALDVPVLFVCGVGVLLTGELLVDGQFITAIVCALVSVGILCVEIPLLLSLFCRNRAVQEDDCGTNDEEEEKPLEYETEEEIEDLPFCQLFTIGEDMCLLIDHIEMCPDEIAFIRVVDDEGYTPLYKRKVRRDKEGHRFISFNSTNHYLDDSKTQPVITKK